MKNIEERLDHLRTDMQTKEFLEGKGLSNEVNIRIFCYDPEDEMTVRHFMERISMDQSMNCHLRIYDLYQVFLDACDEIDIMDAIPEMEEEEGSSFRLEQLHSAIGEEHFIELMQYEPHEPGRDILVLTGVGSVFPFMRIHTLLGAIQPYFSDIPVLVMYPGEFTNYQIRLFNKLQPNDYYRAFNVI